MNLSEELDIEIVGLGLRIGRTLVISDLQLGYEEALTKQGVMLPRFQAKDIMKRLEEMLRTAKPETVVINGDLKHEFGTISDQEWRDALQVFDLLLKYAEKVVVVKGNHDVVLGPLARKRGIAVVESYETGKVLIVHGHKEIRIPENIKMVVIGHEHPAITVREERRAERFKCFLKGKYNGKGLIVMPSMNLLTEGMDITQSRSFSPFLKKERGSFEVFIIADKVYAFGKLANLNKNIYIVPSN